MPSANIDLISFLSTKPADKIIFSGEISITNDGNTGTSDQTAKIVQQAIQNPYGRASLIRVRWSIDAGTNWQSHDTHLTYTYTYTDTGFGFSALVSGLDSAVSVGSSDSEIVFRTANGRHGNVTANMGASITYTPTSRTFVIQYWGYERE